MIAISPSAMRSLALVGAILLSACKKEDMRFVQGYVEGDFVHVAAPAGGRLLSLDVERGDKVSAGELLFSLDETPQRSARDEALHRVEEAEAALADAKLGLRPTEIAAIEAQLDEAKTSLAFSELELQRQQKLAGTGASAGRDLDVARTRFASDQQRVARLEADLQTARLGSRERQIEVAAHLLEARRAALEGAGWALAQRQQTAPVDAQVFDIVFFEGGWGPAGNAVVILLPATSIKVRTFVPEALVGELHIGSSAQVSVDGIAAPVEGRVCFIAPRAEFTPPVIFSQQMREKFVFMVELEFPPEVAVELHPGQPVDVRFPAP